MHTSHRLYQSTISISKKNRYIFIDIIEKLSNGNRKMQGRRQLAVTKI